MIGRLTGHIVDEGDGVTVVVDVGGVGYEVTVPLGTRGRLDAPAGGTVTLHLHTHVREDAIQLFGFASLDGLGVLARMMPQLQVFFLAVPASIMGGMLVLLVVIGVMMSVFIDDLGAFLRQFTG